MVLIRRAESKPPRVKQDIRFGRSDPISIAKAAQICGVSSVTVKKWMSTRWPSGYEKLVRLHVEKKILPESWGKVFFENDLLYLKNGWKADLSDIECIPRNNVIKRQREERHSKEIAGWKKKYEQANIELQKIIAQHSKSAIQTKKEIF